MQIFIKGVIVAIMLFSPIVSKSVMPVDERLRLLVLTDIGGDPDDIQSLRRLLLYANEFRIEGIIATSTSGKGESRFSVKEDLIYQAIDDYAQVWKNLSQHAPGYPSPETLRSIVRAGEANRGVDNLAAGASTTGSAHIISKVDESDKPLHISIWGGAHDLAQALFDVKTGRTEGEVKRFVSKIRVYAINDQDRKYTPYGTGEWIRENFPDMRYIEAGPPWMAITSAVYRGMYQNSSAGGEHPVLPLSTAAQAEMVYDGWVTENVLPWGALGAGYPTGLTQNPAGPLNKTGVKEGDTPSWFYFLKNGLSDPEYPEWGSWGGRFLHQSGGHFTDAQDDHWSGSRDAAVRRKWTVARWREAYQNDFAARMRWCMLPYGEANHNPIAVIDGDSSKNIIRRTLKSGASMKLDASDSHDPDGDSLSFNWWIYGGPSSSQAVIRNHLGPLASVEVPYGAPPGDIHIILEVFDNGTPALRSYRRVIISVERNNFNVLEVNGNLIEMNRKP